jgi:SAM-dependent methyltransferase
MTERPFDPRAYWEARLERSFGPDSVGFLGLGRRYNAWMYRVRGHVFRRTVRRLGLDLARAEVLDVGSGTGFYVREWQSLGAAKVVASDLTEAATRGLAERFPAVEVHRLDVGEGPGPLAGRQFDAISAFDVLYHLFDDDRYAEAFRTIASLLRPGGAFLFSENMLHGESLRVQHQVSRSLETVVQVGREAGFEFVARRPQFFLMNNPVDRPPAALVRGWRLLERVVRRGEPFGFAAGALLYPAELALVSLAHESPTTEVVVCRRA